ncbi:hypothetical protein ABPG73_002271 [Tetrahymena malaccensis]
MYPPIDVYMTQSFVNGKATRGKPLQVYTKEINPQYKITHKKENGEEIYGYENFDEKQGYQDNLRNFCREDGLVYFYSKNKLLKADINQLKKENNTIQMLICVTMYGEPRAFLENTLSSIAANLPQFAKLGISQKQIVVVVLQDGIMKMKEEMEEFYNEQDKFLERKYYLNERRFMIEQQLNYLKLQKKEQSIRFNNGLPTTIPTKTALLYQNEICFNKQDKLVTFSVFKHLNGKKLSSHLWFFEGFCRQFQPKYCALVDVGTLPANDGLVQMYKALEGDSQIGGVCGFMGLKAPVIQQSELTEEQQQEIKDMINKQISDYKKEHFWIDQEYEKQQKEEKLRKIQQQPSRGSKKLSFKPVFNETKVENNAAEILAEQLRVEKKKRKYITDLLIIFNVFFLVQSLLLLIYNIFKYIINTIFKIIVWCLKSYLKMASLPSAQNYEYTTAHMIDKNFESALGFLHVLPGAWSAYRYKALNLSKENRENLIQKRYLKQILYSQLMTNNIQELNMFLAEDRILCLGIYCQLQSRYYLKFVPDAKAFTDPVDKFEEFLNQRRRWINSSWFALNYVLQNYEFHVEESNHTQFSKQISLPFNMAFARIGKWTTYFIPAFYLFVSILSSYQFLQPQVNESYSYIATKEQYLSLNNLHCVSMDDQPQPMCSTTLMKECYILCVSYKVPNVFFTLLNFVPAMFVVVILLIIFASLTFKPKDVEISEEEEKLLNELNQKVKQNIPLTAEKKKARIEIQNKMSQKFQNDVFKVLASIVSITSVIVYIIVLATILFNALNNSYGIITGFKPLKKEFLIYIYVMIALNYGSFYISMFLHLRQPFIVWNVIKSFFSYLLYSPIYNHILMIFSFCNIDDATWGTKGLTGTNGVSKQYTEKIEFVGKWIFLNALLLTVLLIANLVNSSTPIVIMALGAFGSIYFFIKNTIGMFHYLKYFYFDKIVYWYRNKGNKKYYVEYSRQIDHIFNKVLNTNMLGMYSSPQHSIQKDVLSEEIEDDDESNPMTPQNDNYRQYSNSNANQFQGVSSESPAPTITTKHTVNFEGIPSEIASSDQTGRLIKLNQVSQTLQPSQFKQRNGKKQNSRINEEVNSLEEDNEDSTRFGVQTKASFIRNNSSLFQSKYKTSKSSTDSDEASQNQISGPPGPKISIDLQEREAEQQTKVHKKLEIKYPKKQEADDDTPPSDNISSDEDEENGKKIERSQKTHTKINLDTENDILQTKLQTYLTIEDVEINHNTSLPIITKGSFEDYQILNKQKSGYQKYLKPSQTPKN